MAPLDSDKPAESQPIMRILAIGDTESLAETRRVLSRSEFDMYRVPAALAAVRMVRQIPFDLMIVVHPLADTDFGGFHDEIRASNSPCRESQLLVLSPRSRLAELGSFQADSRLQAIDVDQPQHRLAEAASRYLGPIRTAKRYDLRLPVSWGRGDRTSHTADISSSGALIALDDGQRPSIGVRLDLELDLPTAAVALPSQVARLTEAGPDKTRGFAVSWVRAGAAQLDKLDDFLAVRA